MTETYFPKVGDFVMIGGGFVGIVGFVAESIDGETYVQIISPKDAAHNTSYINTANSAGDIVPFRDGMFTPVTYSDYRNDVHLYTDVIEHRRIAMLKNMDRVEKLGAKND